MAKLIQTSICSIIYGRFRGEDNQELFRCPRELDDVDLRRYINETRTFVGFEDDTDVEDLREVPGKELIGYYRLYFKGRWYGSWLLEHGRPDTIDCHGVDEIVSWLQANYPNGCSYDMESDFEDQYKQWGVQEHRFLVKPFMSEYYKVCVDTTYGNGDYPVRIYVYRDKV